jgi:hypothetical protein
VKKAYLAVALGTVALVVLVTSCAPVATATPTVSGAAAASPTPFGGVATGTMAPSVTPTTMAGVTASPSGTETPGGMATATRTP